MASRDKAEKDVSCYRARKNCRVRCGSHAIRQICATTRILNATLNWGPTDTEYSTYLSGDFSSAQDGKKLTGLFLQSPWLYLDLLIGANRALRYLQ